MRGKILILKTGELPAPVSAVHGSCERQFLNSLGGDDSAVVIDVRCEPLPEPEWSGMIITGSGSSVFDGDPWIRACENFIEGAEKMGTPLYGVCFGHQLLARTFGGKVERCPRGWELGTVPIRLTPEGKNDELFAGLPPGFVAQESHRDVVTKLPGGAVRLAENDHAAVQGFRLGDAIWGTQFHPEFSRELMRDLVESLALDFPQAEFAGRPADRPLREWLLAGLCDSPDAAQCLKNFVRQRLAVLLLLLVGLTGCSGSGKSATLVNPHTRMTARCDLVSQDMLDKCVQAAEKRGYVRLEKLTPLQRTELERQGFVVFDDLTSEQRDEIRQQSAMPKKPAASIP
jgi:GMP synthase (glutamine-hydrolysing)